jgi:hypothetical protein
MAQRFGAVFAVAIGSTVFATYGSPGSPATVGRAIEIPTPAISSAITISIQLVRNEPRQATQTHRLSAGSARRR